ncbi:MAG: polyisoprenoid-binding protein YceI [Cyclobacteriaceae bacterium]|jgi:polyisoprenoid-binding protein YceI
MKEIITIIFLLSYWGLPGQQISSMEKESTLTILGTSSLHDWHSSVEQFQFNATLHRDTIKNIQGKIIVKSIKSGKSIMDNKTYDALLANDFPIIEFSSDYLIIREQQVAGQGKLSLSGKEKNIPINLYIEKRDPLIFTGDLSLKMSDFGIAPPEALFGTITTGDEITLQVKISMTKTSIKQ